VVRPSLPAYTSHYRLCSRVLHEVMIAVHIGSCDDVSASHQWRENLSSLTDAVRWSYGAGLVLRLGGIARLELNYVVPMKVQSSDRS